MQRNDLLIGLIEQAASAIIMISPDDLSEVDSLQKIFDQIKTILDETKNAPAEILEQAKNSTTDSLDLIEKILNKQTEDYAEALKKMSDDIAKLQSVSEQLQIPEEDEEEKPEKTDGENTETKNEQTVIPEDDVPLVLDFIAESTEHIETAEAGLLDLEKDPEDKEAINLIFRAFHTIKGMAGFLNLTSVSSLAHFAENLLDLARKDELTLAGNNTDVTFESLDALKKMIAELKDSIESEKPVPAHDGLEQLMERLQAALTGEKLPDTKQQQPEHIQQTEQVEQTQQDEQIEPQQQQESQQQSTETWTGEDRRDKTDRRCSQQPYEGPERRTGTSRRVTTIDEKIKVSTERLDNLINMAGELVIAQLMVAEEISTKLASDHSIKGKITHQGKIVRELQELSMSMRMVPIQGVFQKMARLVRDLSRKADKAVNFVTVGEETELDRSIVDKIADPLVHMIRNSVDHGIETAEERAKTDKDPAGKIELSAYHQAGHIIIEVKDDGRGLNKESILKKAITNGLVDEKQELSDDEICKLIFHAGLSTAKTITTVSGRGVGMDVVKKNIESLKGKVEITSETGKGTTFIIRMPLTLAIIDGQIVTIGPERYIIPINSIIESFRPTAEQLSSVQNKGEMVIVRGQLIPLVRLYKLFNTTPNTQDPTQALLVIVEEDNKKCCFLVDELLGQQQIVIKNLGEGMGTVPGISGGAIMGDGKISLICDVPGLMDLAWN